MERGMNTLHSTRKRKRKRNWNEFAYDNNDGDNDIDVDKNYHFRTVKQAEKDGFYFNPNYIYHDDRHLDLELNDIEYGEKYGFDQFGYLNKNNLFLTPKQIIDDELNRIEISSLEDDKNKISPYQFNVLNEFVGFDAVSKCMKNCDSKYVLEINDSKKRQFYQVMNPTFIKTKQRKIWKRARNRKKKMEQRRQRIRDKMKSMSFSAAQCYALQQTKKEIAEKEDKIKQKQEKQEKHQTVRKMRRRSSWKPMLIASCKQSKRNRMLQCQKQRKMGEEYKIDDLPTFEAKTKYLKRKQFLKKERQKQREKLLSVQQRKDLKAKQLKLGLLRKQKKNNNHHQDQHDHLKYKQYLNGYQYRKYRKWNKNKRRRSKRFKAMKPTKMKYNVFYSDENCHFCQCSKYRKILRKFFYVYKHLKPRDINLPFESIPFCQHILSVRIARITNSLQMITVNDDEIWNSKAIQHITHNTEMDSTYSQYFKWKKKTAKIKKRKTPNHSDNQ